MTKSVYAKASWKIVSLLSASQQCILPFEWNLKCLVARHQWLTPVILATQEAEIKRTEV
jgi:hypothetical protein